MLEFAIQINQEKFCSPNHNYNFPAAGSGSATLNYTVKIRLVVKSITGTSSMPSTFFSILAFWNRIYGQDTEYWLADTWGWGGGEDGFPEPKKDPGARGVKVLTNHSPFHSLHLHVHFRPKIFKSRHPPRLFKSSNLKVSPFFHLHSGLQI
jgi:hypothetical protein